MTHEHPEAAEYAAAAPELERAACASELKPVTIRIKLNPGKEGCTSEFAGFIVPDTDELLAIDERYPPVSFEDATWFITHLPTGVRVSWLEYTRAPTKARACKIAQQFFREYTRRGWRLAGNEHEAIAKRVRDLAADEKVAFWTAVSAP